MVAVSNLKDGLLPLGQWPLNFYNNIAYHAYDSLITENDQGKKQVADLGDKNIMLIQNHGVIIAGKTIHKAMFYTHNHELAHKLNTLHWPCKKKQLP